MAETPIDMGMQSAPPSGSAAPPAAAPAPAPAPAPQQPRGPDVRGHSPSLDYREQLSAGGGGHKVTVAGVEYDEKSIADALAERAEREIVRQGLPAAPDKYEAKLPSDFKAPEGMAFELNADDPAFKQFRDIAHRRGLSQEVFSEALGAFASVKVAELQQINAARQNELNKLGSAAETRIDQVATWLNAKVGDKSKLMVAQLKQYPSAANVEALEAIIRAFSSQGGSTFTQSHREGQDDAGRIAGYENMNFIQRRISQMAAAPAQPRGDRR